MILAQFCGSSIRYVMLCLLGLTLSSSGFSTISSAEEKGKSYTLSNVSALIQSSKAKYKDWYLFIATVQEVIDFDDDGPGAKRSPIQGKTVEFLLPRHSCFQEVSIALTWDKSYSLKISKVKETFFKETLDDPYHDYFIKLDAVVDEDVVQAECFLRKVSP
mgnify:CR=1 FL=1